MENTRKNIVYYNIVFVSLSDEFYSVEVHEILDQIQHELLITNKKKIEFEHINKSKEEILKENIAKIKDFVPYEPILINKGRKKL